MNIDHDVLDLAEIVSGGVTDFESFDCAHRYCIPGVAFSAVGLSATAV